MIREILKIRQYISNASLAISMFCHDIFIFVVFFFMFCFNNYESCCLAINRYINKVGQPYVGQSSISFFCHIFFINYGKNILPY